MRLIFAGTPEVAVPSLKALHAAGHEVATVLTREDAPIGRKRVLTPSPVAEAAEELGLPVLKRNRLDEEAAAGLSALSADLGVVVAYGALLRPAALAAPGQGWINVHFSELPQWRGAAPVQRALIAGDQEAGISVFRLVEQLDAGPLFATRRHPIRPEHTAGSLLAELAEISTQLLLEVLERIAAGEQPVAQQGEPSTAAKLTLDDGRLRPAEGAESVLARWRGVTPEPGAFVLLGEQRLKILEIDPLAADGPALESGILALHGGGLWLGTATEPVRLLRVQPPGKAAMPAADWWRGLQNPDGVRADD